MRAKSKKQKKALALEIIERLKREYPDSDCTLDYNEAWKLLVSVRLAAQCTDARVNIVTKDLFQKAHREAVRIGTQQGAGYQCLHEDAPRRFWL